MTLNEQKRAFSEAWLRAVAAAAGFGIQNGTVPDDQSVDITITSTLNGIAKNPRLDVQLKCTKDDVLVDDVVKFALPQKNYDDLRDENAAVPKILVILQVPERVDLWLLHHSEKVEMYRCAWWCSLRGKPDSGNHSNTTIELPDAQRLTVESLRGIMNRLAEKRAL